MSNQQPFYLHHFTSLLLPVALKQSIQAACKTVDDAIGDGPVCVLQAQPRYCEESKAEKAAGCVPAGVEKHGDEHKQVNAS